MAKIGVTDQNTGRNIDFKLINEGDGYVLPVHIELPPIEFPPQELPNRTTITRWIEDGRGNDILSVHLSPGETFQLQKIYIAANKKVSLVIGYLDTGIFTKIFPAIEINKETLWLDIPMLFKKTFILKIFTGNNYTVGVIGYVQM